MPFTSSFSLPYPALTDPPNGPAQFQALATATESALTGVNTALDTRLDVLEAAPRCRVQFGATYTQTATDTMAQGGWAIVAGEDPLGMFSTVGGFAQIKIPVGYGGRWLISLQVVMDGTTGARMAGVNKNTLSLTTGFLVRDPRNATSAGGDGTRCRASEEQLLADNDILRWVTWSSVSCTAGATLFGLPGAEVYVRRVSAT